MQNPFDSSQSLLDWFKIIQSFRVNEPNRVAIALELDQKSPLTVPVTTGSFGVYCNRSGASAQFLCCMLELSLRVNNRWYSGGRLVYEDRIGNL